MECICPDIYGNLPLVVKLNMLFLFTQNAPGFSTTHLIDLLSYMGYQNPQLFPLQFEQESQVSISPEKRPFCHVHLPASFQGLPSKLKLLPEKQVCCPRVLPVWAFREVFRLN
jgi:hypothetical protein